MHFRRLCDDDLQLLHQWLNEPGVVKWWEGEDVTWPAVVEQYGSANTDPVEHWIAVDTDGRDIGWIQCYGIASFLDTPDDEEVREWVALGIPTTAGGIDYVIGDPAGRGEGRGSTMIRTFVEQVVFVDHPDWDPICASPYAANLASWKALANAGFSHDGTFEDEVGTCNLMVRRRPDE